MADPLRILFVSGVADGGSPMSTERLARALAKRGHDVTMLVPRPRSAPGAYLVRRLDNAAVKSAGRRWGQPVERLARAHGRRRRGRGDALVFEAHSVVNAPAALLRAGQDVVVASSMSKLAWQRLDDNASAASIPAVLYLREHNLLGHLDGTRPPRWVVANAESLAAEARDRGFACPVVRSIVDTCESLVDSSRTTLLAVNGSLVYGLDLIIGLAEAIPEIPIAVQESRHTAAIERARLADAAARLPNLDARPFVDRPAAVYRDARVLLLPYTDELQSNRPRVVVEAQVNGIPAVARALPGLQEVVGDGGVYVARDASVAEWAAAVRGIWSDPAYEAIASRARRNGTAVPTADDVAAEFEALLGRVVAEPRSALRP